jgi:hypothetical protein
LVGGWWFVVGGRTNRPAHINQSKGLHKGNLRGTTQRAQSSYARKWSRCYANSRQTRRPPGGADLRYEYGEAVQALVVVLRAE